MASRVTGAGAAGWARTGALATMPAITQADRHGRGFTKFLTIRLHRQAGRSLDARPGADERERGGGPAASAHAGAPAAKAGQEFRRGGLSRSSSVGSGARVSVKPTGAVDAGGEESCVTSTSSATEALT